MINLEMLGAPQKASQGEMRYNCPFCEKRGKDVDYDYHLYVNREKGVFYCQRCGAKGHIDKGEPLQICDIEEIEKMFVSMDEEKLEIKPYVHFSDFDEVVYNVELPSSARPLGKNSVACEYLVSRGFTYEDLAYWGVMVDGGGRFPRILFPDYRNRHPVFWVTRRYIEGDTSPKYMNGGFCWTCANCGSRRANEYFDKGTFVRQCLDCKSPMINLNSEARARGYIFGLFRRLEEGAFFKNPYVVVTEGPTSCMMAHLNSVATLGKGITEKQLEVLMSLKLEIVFALDNDALSEIVGYANNIYHNHNHHQISVIPMKDGEDPGSLGKDEMIHRFENRMKIDHAEDLLSMSLHFL